MICDSEDQKFQGRKLSVLWFSYDYEGFTTHEKFLHLERSTVASLP